ncbi:MAG: PAS domain-containing protein [Chitinophagaceae bacterium]
METTVQTRQSLNNLSYLPSFAEYLLAHRLRDLVEEQLRISTELNLPLLQAFKGFSNEQLIEFSMESSSELLRYLANNKARDQIQHSLKRWVTNQLPNIDKYEVQAEDITLISYMRKVSFLHFIPDYCRDVNEMMELIKEVDLYLMEYESASTNTYFHLLQQRINEHEARYKQAEALTHIGNYIFDLASPKVEWSDELYRIYGLDPKKDKITVNGVTSFLHPDEIGWISEQTKKAIETLKPFDYKYRIILKDGTRKILHARGEVIVNEENIPIKIIGTAQDVTEREHIEEELRENQVFIKKIADATPSIIASYNVNTGKYVFISQGLKKLLGYDAEQVMQQGAEFIAELIHPDDFGAIMEKNGKALDEANFTGNNDLVTEFIYRMRHKNGEYRWFHTYGAIFDRDEQGKVEHVLNITLDITGQTKANEKIKEQEYFIKHIADASPTILYLFDVAANSIVYINQEIYFVLGYTTEEILASGDDVTNLLYHPDDYNLLPERKESTKRFQLRGSMVQYECRMKSKDGEWKWMLIREIIFKTDDDGNVSQILGAALDISKRKEMERSLLQNSFQLEQSNTSLEEFAYIASHDMKEPLRKISTFGDRLINSELDKLSDNGKAYLKKIVEASHRLQAMINDLLSISLISGDKTFQRYSLASILDDALQALEHKIEQKNAIINSDLLPEAHIVPSQFRQLFQNIISNSLKFSREDVQLVITIKHSIINGDEVLLYRSGGNNQYHKLEFIDNGIGFEDEFAGRIFTIFQRLHSRSEYEGTGIGLAICKKIVEHHGGIITARGIPDKGATFTIILPE